MAFSAGALVLSKVPYLLDNPEPYRDPVKTQTSSSSLTAIASPSVRFRSVAIAAISVSFLGLSLVTGPSANAATVKSGASCTKSGRVAKVGTSSFRCTKSKGKLKWVLVKKAVAKDTKAPDTKAPDTKAPDTKAPDTKAPDTKAPDTKAPDTKAPVAKAPDTKAP
jgi:hypothetical protein